MRDPVAPLLARQSCVVLDGALATELERRGADLADPLWSARCLLERPELIGEVHRDYFEAGADVATTATYQASFEGFARRGLDRDDAVALMRLAVHIAVEARDRFWDGAVTRSARARPLVAASIGPYGAMLADGSEYRGRYAASDAELADFHSRRLEALADCGAELFACETLPCLREARIVARAVRDCSDLPAWIAFTCRDGARNAEGEDFGDCVAALEEFPQVLAVGVNCSAPEHVGELLSRARVRTHRPLIAYPNSGETYDAVAKRWRPAPPAARGPVDGVAAHAAGWVAAGARLLGGCCRTTPADIAALRRALLAPAQ